VPPQDSRYPSDLPFERVALVVHPTRKIDGALATIERWTKQEDLALIQLAAQGSRRDVAPEGGVGGADLVVALGGDGTVLAALRAAAGTSTAVLGVACGSLGALSAVTADELDQALDRFRSGDWIARSLPVLEIGAEGAGDWAINDFVAVRRGAGQITTDVTVDGELFARMAGDGLIIATAVGSSAYSMATGGPLLATGTAGFLCTPIAMHGGSAPPLVVPADAKVVVDVGPGYAGFDIEIDGQRRELAGTRFSFTLDPHRLRLVTFEGTGRGLTGLRRRGLIEDSPRIRIREARGR
jgi:NAD+ kinase